MSLFHIWFSATRPRTLAAGVAPVLVGTALGGTVAAIDWRHAGACLIGAILIQIGSNFANDAFDGLRGADTPERMGPQRAVASGLISAKAMLWATALILILALGVGLYLSSVGGWPILLLGLISLVCAVAYTGGPYPLAYHGLGDLFVFLFFGLFAVLGSAWLQICGHDPLSCCLPLAWWGIAAALGLQATSIIAVNNLRDLATDTSVGKRTLAVRMGDRASRWYIAGLHAGATGLLLFAALRLDRPLLFIPATLAGLGGLLFCRGLFLARGQELNRYLARSAALELFTAAALALVLMV